MRTIALSNLSLLPWSLLLGPAWTWKIAEAVGYDALKVNPLRGWNVEQLKALKSPVTAFECLWRSTFRASVKNLWDRRDIMGFVADTCFIGYAPAETRCEGYAWSDYYGSQGTIGVDFPANLQVGHLRNARETEYLPEKWPAPLDDSTLVCLDTWHVRSYPDPSAVTDRLIDSGRITLIDVQTRGYADLLDNPVLRAARARVARKHRRCSFCLGKQLDARRSRGASNGCLLGLLRGEDVILTRQLRQLSALPKSVSASVEVSPQQVFRLMTHLSRSYQETLLMIQQCVRRALD